MTLDEWIKLAPKDCAAIILSPEGQHMFFPKDDGSGMVPEWCGDAILLCAGILSSGNEDLQELVRQRLDYNNV